MSNKLTKLRIRKGQFFAFMAMFLMAGLLFASLIPVSGLEGKLMDDDTETDELDETSESEHEEDDDDDDDGVEDDEEEVNERKLEVQVQDYQAQIESELEIGDSKDEIKLEMQIGDEPKFKLEYESESGSLETEIEFSVKFYSLVEYIDSDADGIYNDSKDELIQEIRLDSKQFLPLVHTTSTTGVGTTMHKLNATTDDGMFSLQVYLVEEFTIIAGSLITPTETKMDIAIHDFPYKNDSSVLALKVKIEAEAEAEHDDETMNWKVVLMMRKNWNYQ
ncbi:MAG: hypothetical protein ACW98W_08930 [Candidatus Hodarchaeales archaeon]|jgi:hypothetical protein